MAVVSLATATAVPVWAHDFWIEPSSFRPKVVSTVRVALEVGDDFAGRRIPRSADHIVTFEVVGPDGRRPVPGREGMDPAGLLNVTTEGALVLLYSSRPTAIELPADRFESYLKSEGLERVIEMRAERGESDAPGRERFSRCAKSLLLTAGADPDRAGVQERMTAVTGLPLELVPETNPYAGASEEPLPLRLLYRSEPLAGALVKARNRNNPARVVEARTDAEGRVSLPLAEPGVWLVAAVHMDEAEKGADVDWQSFWASLTFESR